MKNTFTLGAIAGISTIALAVPILAQISSAQTPANTGTSPATTSQSQFPTRPPPTVKNVQDMITKDNDFLSNIDTFVTVQKSATQAHVAALTAAASITDDAQRQAAVEKANTDERSAIQTAVTANPSLKSAMMPFGHGPGRPGFGGPGGHGGFGGFGHGRPNDNDADDTGPAGTTPAPATSSAQ